MPKLAVLGYYGHGNFGDEVMLEGLRCLFKGWQVIPLSSETFSFDVVNGCDLFVVGGGELIYQDQLCMPTPSVFKFKNHSLAYKLYNRTYFAHSPWVHKIKIPKIILGCGINRDRFTHFILDELRQFDYIGLRDQASVDSLIQFSKFEGKIHLFYDLAFQNEVHCSKHKENYAVVIPTDRQNLNVIEQSRKWLEANLKDYEKVVFIPFGQEDNNDFEACKSLTLCSKNSVVLSHGQSLPTVLKLFSEAKKIFPYRLHGLILSFMVGAPYNYYPYHPKLQRVNETLVGKTLEEIRASQQAELTVIKECCI